MKTRSITLCACVLIVGVLQAGFAQTREPGGGQTDTTQFSISERGPHHRVWAKVSYETNRLGRATSHTNSYTELETGMHYLESGQWVESRAEIEIVENGAAALHGPHKVLFAANVATAGAVDMQTPDEKRLRSHIIGLSYFDGATGQGVLIAEPKDCIGQLSPPNEVIYADAFDDVKASVQYEYTKAGFEQNIILREQPPPPEKFGLNADTTRLQVLTEFIEPPVPRIQTTQDAEDPSLVDESLDFGSMQIGPGRGFTLGQESGRSVRVFKQWTVIEGRTFLVEEVPLRAIADQLQGLPERLVAAIKPRQQGQGKSVIAALAPRLQKHVALVSTNVIQVAWMDLKAQPGFVFDYESLASGTNFTFKGDTTYYVSGAVNIAGTNTFEGGTVIKYATNASVAAHNQIPLRIIWLGSPYRPVVFTAKDDDSVGQAITGSTGNPTGYYANSALTLTAPSPTPTLAYFRISYAKQAVTLYGTSPTFYHGQFVNCQNGITFPGAGPSLRNVLFSNVQTIFNNIIGSVDAQNVTFSGSDYVVALASYSAGVFLKNCLFANVANRDDQSSVTFYGDYNGFFNSPSIGGNTITNSSMPFHTVSAGAHYLTPNSPWRNAGTTSIDTNLLAELQKKTTYPPLLLSNTLVVTDTTLAPQAQRDTDVPDLGYHYDSLDYLLCDYKVTNATLTLANGTAIGYYDTTGIWLQDGAGIDSVGTPLGLNRFAPYLAVQEQSLHIGSSGAGTGAPIVPYREGGVGSPGTFQFTYFTRLASSGAGYDLYEFESNSRFSSLTVSDCSFAGGRVRFMASSGFPLIVRNNYFERAVTYIGHSDAGESDVSVRNNLYRNQSFLLENYGSSAWVVKDNAFDASIVEDWGDTAPDHSHNAYINTTGRLYPTNASDVVLTNFLYAAGLLGNYYQASTNLVDAGSVANAAFVGLYHYTTLTNQVKEATNRVDIGFHYVAVTNGVPVDSDGEGLADYFEDTNGDGSNNAGDLANWNSNDSDSDGISDFIEFIQGRNPRVAGTVVDTNGVTNLKVYTPLR